MPVCFGKGAEVGAGAYAGFVNMSGIACSIHITDMIVYQKRKGNG